MGIDKHIKAGVLLVTGGNSEKIVQMSRANAFRKRYKRSKAEYNEIQHYLLLTAPSESLLRRSLTTERATIKP